MNSGVIYYHNKPVKYYDKTNIAVRIQLIEHGVVVTDTTCPSGCTSLQFGKAILR